MPKNNVSKKHYQVLSKLFFSFVLLLTGYVSYAQKRDAREHTWYSNAREIYGVPSPTDSVYIIFEFTKEETPNEMMIDDQINFTEKIVDMAEVGLYADNFKPRVLFIYNLGKYTDLKSSKKFRLQFDVYNEDYKVIRTFHLVKEDLEKMADLYAE